MKLNKREKNIFAYICGYIQDNEYSPTLREISESEGISQQMVGKILSNLEEKKLIYRTDGKYRNIAIIEDKKEEEKKEKDYNF